MKFLKSLHPNHRPDYVFYQLGLSPITTILPGAIDRDLSLAVKSC